MAKYKNVKLKVARSGLPLYFKENTLVKGRLMLDGTFYAKDRYGVWFPLRSNMTIEGEDGNGEKQIIEFVLMKTKTIKCTWVNHSMQIKKTFKTGKRYQIEQGRALGAVAGYVYDEDGDRFMLEREEVGFSAGAGAYLFEAKYS